MNRETKKFEPILTKDEIARDEITLPLGTVTPRHARLPATARLPVFMVGELIVLKDVTFEIVYVGESTLLLEPAEPAIITEITAKP